MIGLVIFLAVAVDLVISGFIATKFDDIAKLKGHDGYFLWCFLLGPVGWAMVIALPDRNAPTSQTSGAAHPASSRTAAEPDDTLPDL